MTQRPFWITEGVNKALPDSTTFPLFGESIEVLHFWDLPTLDVVCLFHVPLAIRVQTLELWEVEPTGPTLNGFQPNLKASFGLDFIKRLGTYNLTLQGKRS